MIESNNMDDDSETHSDFAYEAPTTSWEPKRPVLDNSFVVWCYLAVLNEQMESVIKHLEAQMTEGERIRELARRLDEANQQLEELVVRDPLTGIGNRRLFAERLELKIAEAERGSDLTVFFIDIDDFKSYNDHFGHKAGDDALKAVAAALDGVVRRTDCLARYGGEEFVLASTVGLNGAKVLANKLLAAVRNISDSHRKLTVSIGMATYTAVDSASVIMSRADAALYEAKKRGKDRFVTFESEAVL